MKKKQAVKSKVAAKPVKAVTKPVAKPAVKPVVRRKVIHADAIKPSSKNPEVDENGVKQFILTAVILGGVQRDYPCTQKMFVKVTQEDLPRQVTSEFDLRFDEEGRVDHISIVDKLSPMKGFKVVKEDGRPSDKEDGGNLVVVENASGEFEADTIPSRMTSATVETILSEMNELDSPTAGDFFGDSDQFKIAETRDRGDGKQFVIQVSR